MDRLPTGLSSDKYNRDGLPPVLCNTLNAIDFKYNKGSPNGNWDRIQQHLLLFSK